MSVGFGFSVGDFVAALELVGTVIDALRDSGSASAEYRELLRVLYSLETALIQVKRLEVHESQHAELIALRQAASQCQRTIDNFWSKTRKYQPHLGSSSECSDFYFRTAWTKIKWAVCKRDDLARFKADLIGHTESIQLLLAVIQMKQTNVHGEETNEGQRTLLGRLQDSYQSSMQRLSGIADGISRTISQGKELLDLMAQTARTNVQVFTIVLDIQNLIKHIPRQVQRQQPVFLIDALGKHSPFHLEFIRSANALTAVLRSNLSKYGKAPEKIDRGEFVIQDTVTKRDVNLHQDWDLCFLPGQRVNMSMILDRPLSRSLGFISCPKCQWLHEGLEDVETECVNCGLIFETRLLDGEQEGQRGREDEDRTGKGSAVSILSGRDLGPDLALMTGRKRRRIYDGTTADEVAFFKRIRIRAYKQVSWLPNLTKANTADVVTFSQGTGELFFKALMDSGTADNFISEETALQTGFNIDPYTGSDMVDFSGLATFRPVGRIKIVLSLTNTSVSWNVHCFVVAKARYQILLGRDFIIRYGTP